MVKFCLRDMFNINGPTALVIAEAVEPFAVSHENDSFTRLKIFQEDCILLYNWKAVKTQDITMWMP